MPAAAHMLLHARYNLLLQPRCACQQCTSQPYRWCHACTYRRYLPHHHNDAVHAWTAFITGDNMQTPRNHIMVRFLRLPVAAIVAFLVFVVIVMPGHCGARQSSQRGSA